MHPLLTAARDAIVAEEGAHGWLRQLEHALEFAKTELNIDNHLRDFKRRTDPNYDGKDAA